MPCHQLDVIGKAARELGFRGVSIDVEYPYRRYSLDHEIYTYDDYTVEELLDAALEQERIVMSALLSEFPELVVFALPGELWCRPIGRAFLLAMLQVMAEKNAPGGFHLGHERAYCLYEPTSQVAIPRVGDCMARVLLDGASLDYWKRRCSVAPGVWPLHMVETGGEDYPVRSWSEELAELEQQMDILRSVAKRYIWSYSDKPVWYLHTPELEAKYGLTRQVFDGAEEAISGWRQILPEKRDVHDARIRRLMSAISEFDRGAIDCAELCSRFGTPGDWLVLGPLGNPFIQPEYSATNAIHRPIRFDEAIHDRDGVVRWFVFHNYEPLGSVRLRAAFDWRRTDDCSVHLAAVISAPEELEGYLWLEENTRFELDLTPVNNHLAGAGAEGVSIGMLIPRGKSTYQSLVEHHVGTVELVYAAVDYPAVVEELYQVMVENDLKAVRLAVEADYDYFLTWEDSGTQNYSPTQYDRFIGSEIGQWCDILAQSGKRYIQHACGNVKALVGRMRDHGTYGVESIPTPPTGDISIAEARRTVGDGFAIIGGIEPTHFLNLSEQELGPYVERVIAEGQGGPFVLANSDSCPPGVTVEKFRIAADVARSCGR